MRLQKIIIVFAVLILISAIFGLPFSLITATIFLGILSLGFFGAYYRRTCMLKAYAIIRTLELVLHFLMVVVAVVITFLIVGVFIASAYTGDQTTVNTYIPTINYYLGQPHSTPMQPAPPVETSTTVQVGAPKSGTVQMGISTTTTNNQMGVSTTIGKPVQEPEPVPEPYYENYFIGYITNVYYSDYVSNLTTLEIVGLTAIITATLIVSVILSLVYYAFVLYTVILAFRMSCQIKHSAAAYSAVTQKEFQLQEMHPDTPQPFVYVVADPNNGNQPVLLQPVDPSVYQMQTLA